MITLKNVKNHPDMSQETSCFSATIYVDKKRVGFVENTGNGGPNRYTWLDPKVRDKVELWAATQPTEYDFERLDQIIDGLLNRQHVEAQLRKAIKKETLFRLVGDKPGNWRSLNSTYNNSVEKYLKDKYGSTIEVIANADLEKAVACVIVK